MKVFSIASFAVLGAIVQSSLQTVPVAQADAVAIEAATSTSKAATATPSAYVRITKSSNSSLNGLYGFVDPQNDQGYGVVFQFTANKSVATPFRVQVDTYYGPLLQGYKPDYVAGSTNAEGTPKGGAVYISPRNQYIQGGEPLINVSVGNKSHVVALTDQLGDGLVRNITQACLPSGVGAANTKLPVLVVGEKHFTTDGCANVTLVWAAIN